MARKRSLSAGAPKQEDLRGDRAEEDKPPKGGPGSGQHAPFAPGNTTRAIGGPGKHTTEETRQQMAAVEAALMKGWSIEKVMSAAPSSGMKRGRAKVLVMRVWEAWRQADVASREHNRATHVRIAYKELERARTPDPKTGRVNHHAIRGYMDFLARLQGTYEPIEVSVVDRVAQSLVPTIAGLSGQQVEEYTRRAQDRKALAAVATRMLEERKDREAIDVKGEAAE